MNHGCTADDYIFIVTHAQFIHYFVEANIIGTRCRKPLRSESIAREFLRVPGAYYYFLLSVDELENKRAEWIGYILRVRVTAV